jgi:hypothetical protein
MFNIEVLDMEAMLLACFEREKLVAESDTFDQLQAYGKTISTWVAEDKASSASCFPNPEQQSSLVGKMIKQGVIFADGEANCLVPSQTGCDNFSPNPHIKPK